MQNFNKFALDVLGSARLQACWFRRHAETNLPFSRSGKMSGCKEKSATARRARQHAWRRALPGTSPDQNFDPQQITDHGRAAIAIDLDTGATIAARCEQPVYSLHRVVKNNESEDPTEHH